MLRWRAMRDGLRRLLRPAQFERDLEDELSHFIELEARDHMDHGTPERESYRIARATLGGKERMKEDARAGGWEFLVYTMWQDIRYALRSLRRSAGFFSAAVLTLAIGIGGTTTVFTLVNAILLRPPAHVVAPEQLVSIYTSDYSGPPYGSTSHPDFEDFRRQTDIFAGVIATQPAPIGIGEGEDLTNDGMEVVSGDYFQVLGVRAAAGRFFAEDEDRGGSPIPVAVISYDLWQQRFAGRADAVGSSLQLNGSPFTIVGVAPDGFLGAIRGIAMNAWIPVAASPLVGMSASATANRGNRSFFVIGRLAPGVSVQQAEAGMATVGRNLAASYPDRWIDLSGAGRRVSVLPEAAARIMPQVRGPALGFMALLMGTMVLVLLVCCANVAGLMLARAARRAREMGVRLSLGASRRRVMRQLLTESTMVALCGGIGGVALAVLAMSGIAAWQPPLPVRIAVDLSIDARVLAFAIAAVAFTGVLFGVVPALRGSRAPVTGLLKGDGGTTQIGGRRISLQGALVSGQVAISLLLMVGALLFVRSLRSASEINTGFATDHMLVVDVELRPDVTAPVDRAQVVLRMQERLRAVPGVRGASWARSAPFGFGSARRGISVDGYEPAQGEDMEYHFNIVGPDYFDVLQMPLVLGRPIDATDRAGAPLSVVVNETFARKFWPGESPLGKRIRTSGPESEWSTVVGMARDAKYSSLTEDARPFMYLAALQSPTRVVLHLRTSADPVTMRETVRRELLAVAPDWRITALRTMEQQLGVTLAPHRAAGALLSLFAAVAALLASVGLYGVVAMAVTARRREIGIRVALGADRHGVVRFMVGKGVLLAGIGVVIGLPAAWAVSRLLSSFLIGPAANDPATFAGATVLLTAVALVAAWIPARRAANVHPMIALRDE